MTRNPETTEAAKEAEALEAALLAHPTQIYHEVGLSPGPYYALCLGDCPWETGNLTDEDECYRLAASHQAEAVRAVLAVSPAVTGQDERARRALREISQLTGYGQRGTVDEAVAIAREALAAPSPAVTAAEDETHGYCTCDGPRPMRDCGVKAHRDQAFAARPAPVVAAVPADPNSED